MGFQLSIEHLNAGFSKYLPRAASAAVILLLSLGVALAARKIVELVLRRANPEAEIFLGRATFIGVLVGGALVALGATGMHIAALVTLLGAFGLAVSLSLQDVAKNVVAGLYLLMERPFRMGDQITVLTFTGRVEAIGLRTVILRTEAGQQVLVPNTIVLSEVVMKHPVEKKET
jgi:small conductance mechanosensitive channel